MEKRVNVRVEHIKHSKCRDDFLKRVKKNAAMKKEAKAKGGKEGMECDGVSGGMAIKMLGRCAL